MKQDTIINQKIDEVIIENSILSKYHDEFIKASENLAPRIQTDEESVHPGFKDYQYPVCSWPVLIDPIINDRLKKLSTRIPQLLARVPELYFKNDINKIADFYYEGNRVLAEFGMICYNKKQPTSSRLDLTLTNDGFKILEANMGPSLGGFQVQSFETLIRKLHPQLNGSAATTGYTCENVQKAYFKYLSGEVMKHVSNLKGEINIFVGMDAISEQLINDTLDFFGDLWSDALKERGIKGEAITGDISKLKVVGNNVYFGNKRIHGITLLNTDIQLVPAVYRAYIINNLYITYPLNIRMIEDKRNLGILRQLAEENTFDAEDNQLIIESIPYTQIVEDKTVTYKGASHSLISLLKSRKDEFVVKDAGGAQGIDVFVGKFMSQEDWEKAIEYALTHKNFITQEFYDSINFTAPNRFNEWGLHKLIWGSFGFGDSYGGVWVRMSELKTDVGVINSAKGAVEAIVFTVDS
jgi:hypothetical protein